MAFLAEKIDFSWSPSITLLRRHCGEGNHISPRPQLHLTLHFKFFFNELLLKS